MRRREKTIVKLQIKISLSYTLQGHAQIASTLNSTLNAHDKIGGVNEPLRLNPLLLNDPNPSIKRPRHRPLFMDPC